MSVYLATGTMRAEVRCETEAKIGAYDRTGVEVGVSLILIETAAPAWPPTSSSSSQKEFLQGSQQV